MLVRSSHSKSLFFQGSEELRVRVIGRNVQGQRRGGVPKVYARLWDQVTLESIVPGLLPRPSVSLPSSLATVCMRVLFGRCRSPRVAMLRRAGSARWRSTSRNSGCLGPLSGKFQSQVAFKGRLYLLDTRVCQTCLLAAFNHSPEIPRGDCPRPLERPFFFSHNSWIRRFFLSQTCRLVLLCSCDVQIQP